MKRTCLFAGLIVLTPVWASAQSEKSITETIQNDQRFTSLRQLLKTTGLDRRLGGTESFTLFAPTDAAFKKLPKDALKAILTQDRFGSQVAMAHLLKGQYSTLSFSNGVSRIGEPLRHQLLTFGEYRLTTEMGKDGLTANGAKIVGEIHAKNGTILIVDSVMPLIILAPETEGLSRSLAKEFFEWGMARYYKGPPTRPNP